MKIKTKRNCVIADDPEPDDVFVRVAVLGEDLSKPHVLAPCFLQPLTPISEYQTLVDWAVSVADQFARPLYVVPVSANRFLHTDLFTPYRKMIATLPNQEWGELRQLCIATAAEVMRDCDDSNLRRECYDILIQLKVINP